MSRRVSFRSRTRAVAFVSVVVGGSVAALSATVAGVVGSSGCNDTITYNTALVSGIDINTDLLLGNGSLSCGTSDQNVYKYVAVVINDAADIGGAGIFDCFADGVFANLPGTDAGSLNFAIWIYAYNQKDFNAANGSDNALINAVNRLNGVNQPDGSFVALSALSIPDGGTSQGRYAAALSTICLRPSTWVSTCSASSQPGVQFLAACAPLTLESNVHSSCNLALLLPDAAADAHHD
jgi:hypothetical protein